MEQKIQMNDCGSVTIIGGTVNVVSDGVYRRPLIVFMGGQRPRALTVAL